jgi:hypothetical protein
MDGPTFRNGEELKEPLTGTAYISALPFGREAFEGYGEIRSQNC